MNHDERVAYARSILDLELGEAVDLRFVSPEYWVEHFILDSGVDPMNVHKPYGLVRPQWVQEHWMMGVSIEHLLRPVANLDEETFNTWLQYWVTHMVAHFSVWAKAADNDEMNIPLAEEERRVDEEVRVYEMSLYEFGEHIKSLQ